MGVVLAATHLQLNQPVALKFIVDAVSSRRSRPSASCARRATFRLRSEHTVRVIDVGTLPTGEPFMVMEQLDGKDLKQLLAERGPLPVAEAVDLRDAGLRRARGGARARHRPSRSQARETSSS